MTTSLTCGVKSFIYQSSLAICGRKSFPDQMGKNRDWNRGDPVLFLQQCPHSLQRKPATPRACFSQHRQLVEGGPCAKGEGGASKYFLLAWRLCESKEDDHARVNIILKGWNTTKSWSLPSPSNLQAQWGQKMRGSCMVGVNLWENEIS